MKTSPLSLKSRLDLSVSGQFFPVSVFASALSPVTTDDIDDPAHPVHGIYNPDRLPLERAFLRSPLDVVPTPADVLTGAPAPCRMTDEEWHKAMDALYGPLETRPTDAQKLRSWLFALLFSCIVYMTIGLYCFPHADDEPSAEMIAARQSVAQGDK